MRVEVIHSLVNLNCEFVQHGFAFDHKHITICDLFVPRLHKITKNVVNQPIYALGYRLREFRMEASLYCKGTILTMVGDSEKTVKYAEAVVEKGGKIAFVGALGEAKRIYPKAKEIDLGGRCMMPGHIDPHLHPSMGSMILSMNFITPFDWSLPSGDYQGVRTQKGYRNRLKTLINDNFPEYSKIPTACLITWGYHGDFHGEMSREIIDNLDVGKSNMISVVVWQRSFHEVYLNSFALDHLQCDDLDALKENLQVDWETGHFYEMGLDALMATTNFGDQVFPLIEKGYPELVKVVNRNGITAVGDLEFPLFEEGLEKDMAEKNLKSKGTYFSTYCVASSRNYERMAGGDREKAMKLIGEASDDISGDQLMLYKDHIKLLLDGAFYSQLMQMKDGYLDEHEGQWITPTDEFEEAMEVYWKNGYQIHIHTNGDLGMEELLDTVEGLLKRFPRKNHRTTVEHAGYFTEDQAERIAKLGLMVSAAPYYFYTLADKYSGDKALGPDRARAIAPMKWLFERGVVTAFHSDFTMAPSQPLLYAWCAINRITAEGLQHRDDLCCSIYEGMLAITKNAAIILGTDDIMGTIEEGKLANFTILDKDPLKLHPTAIKDIKVHASVYKGRKNIVNL
ncbi:hypothetical protein QZH41_003579 [Actinostola sp. cb2023]|nr:hypothetical protein QZH41_003579 [Actinostola sp. cb2023]